MAKHESRMEKKISWKFTSMEFEENNLSSREYDGVLNNVQISGKINK